MKKILSLLIFSLICLHANRVDDEIVKAHIGTKDANITKILSAGKVADLLLFSLAKEKMLGLAGKHKSEPYIKHDLPFLGTINSRGAVISTEKIITLKPDLIFDVGSVSNSYLQNLQRIHDKTGANFILIDGNLEQSPKMLRTAGKYLQSEKAESLAVFAEQILNKTKNALKDKNIKVYYARGANGLESVSNESIHGEVLEFLGLKNVIDLKSKKSTVEVSAELLFKLDPDLIIVQNPSLLKTIESSSIFSNLNAVKKGNVLLVPNRPFGWIDQPPSINRLLGLVYLTHKFAPKKLDKIEYEKLIKQYFKLFYDYDLTNDEIKTFG